MIRCAAKVWLSQETRDDLERYSRSRTLAVRLVERARIVLRAAAGQENQQIADELGLCRQSVSRWRARFAATQMDGLEDRPRSGRPARILAPTIDEVVRLTTREKPAAETHWSTRTMAAVVGVSAATVGRIWRAHGLKPHRVKNFKLSNDPHFAEKLGDVVDLYLHPPQDAVVISVDEKCQIQALDRTQPGLPWKKGRCGTMTHDY
jgi:transposase